ncbi:MAG: CAP domain-containing protein [Actinomycetota bacterium]
MGVRNKQGMKIRALIAICACAVLALAAAPQLGAMKVSRLLAPVSVCPDQNDSRASVASQEAAMRCLHSYARKKAHRGQLDDVGKLDDSAGNKARDILHCGDFSHYACGRDFLYWFEQLDYVLSGCWRAGENIAWGNGDYGTVRSIMRSWLRSPGHRANILSGSFDQFGVGLRVGSLNGAQDAHVWAGHFGNHC